MVDSRKAVRADLVTKLKTVTGLATETGGAAHVLGYLATDFAGKSPMCTVESGPSQGDTENEGTNDQFGFIVGMWVKRDEGTASAAEDTLDDLEYGLRLILRKNYNGRFAQKSQPDYSIIGGEDYRVEFHFVEIDW